MTVASGHHGFVSVAGESHYQETLRELADRLGPDGVLRARLAPEPDNPHDDNAVAVCVDDGLAKIGYLPRQVAANYQPRLLKHGAPVTCPARLTGRAAIGVVLDFEEVRVALGLPRVSIDQGDMDYEAVAEYHRLNHANREFVRDTRPLEKTNPSEAIARYRQAISALRQCQDLARSKGLDTYGFNLNQTDAIPMERLTMCLIKMGFVEDAATEIGQFVEAFPYTAEMTLIKTARERIDRARRA
jgi:hypothetical protein